MFKKIRGSIKYVLDDRPFIVQLQDIVDNSRHVAKILKHNDLRLLVEWIDSQTPLLNDPIYTIITKVYWVLNGITSWQDSRVICEVCGKPFERKNVKRLSLGYSRRCSAKCMNSDPKHIKQVVDSQCRHVKENPDYWKDRNEKTKQTKIKSGHEWNWTNPEKAKKTKLRSYGDPTWNNRDKARSTRYQKNNGKWHSDDFVSKSQNTMLQRHGYRCPFASNGIRHTFDIKAIRAKARQTMKRNGTYLKSKAEDKCYDLLCEYFGESDIDRYHKTKWYPFNCDFYIKSFDLYIEFNGTWTHGFHEYDSKSDIDTKRLEFLNEKVHETGSKYYKSAIYVWTNLDPRKRKTAKDNQLNFVEFWNVNELEQWLSDNFIKDPY